MRPWPWRSIGRVVPVWRITCSAADEVPALILTGSFIAKGDAKDLDLFIVGDVKEKDLEKFISENFSDEIVRHGLMTREDFLYRLTLKDKFVQKLFNDSDNIVLKNKLKKDTEELVRG